MFIMPQVLTIPCLLQLEIFLSFIQSGRTNPKTSRWSDYFVLRDHRGAYRWLTYATSWIDWIILCTEGVFANVLSDRVTWPSHAQVIGHWFWNLYATLFCSLMCCSVCSVCSEAFLDSRCLILMGFVICSLGSQLTLIIYGGMQLLWHTSTRQLPWV